MRDEKPSRSSKRANNSEPSPDELSESRGDESKRSTRNGRGSVTYPTLIRHVVFFILFLASGIGGLIYRDEVMKNVGYGTLPLGIWGALFSYLLINRSGWLVSRYRETISSFVVVLGGVTVLGIFDAPLGSATGDTMGGRLGEILAREPYDWHRYDLVLWQQMLAWVRAGVLFTAGAAAQFPRALGLTMKVIWIGTLMAVSGSVGLLMMAGGAAASIATKRRKDDADAEGADEIPQTGALGDQLDDVQQPSQWDAVGSYSHGITDDEFDGALVVGMGDTINVEDDEPLGEMAEESWISPEPADSPAAHKNSDQEEDSLGEFIEVGTSLQNEFDDRDANLEIDADTTSNNHLSVEEIPATATEEIVADVEEVPVQEVAAPINDDTDEVLEMITSGAAIEAAMNAFPWHLPPVEYLASPPKGGVSTTEIKATSDLIEETLDEHGVSVSVDQVRVGPTVTMYGLKPGWKGGGAKSKVPAQRVRVDTILNREKDIALALSSPNIRFESVVPGSSFVGIEVPNAQPTPVNLRTVMDSPEWTEFAEDAAMPVPLGMGSGGDPVMADFAKMPHTLGRRGYRLGQERLHEHDRHRAASHPYAP